MIFPHDGTFTLVGNKYVETIIFANERSKHLVGNVVTFKFALTEEAKARRAPYRLKTLHPGQPFSQDQLSHEPIEKALTLARSISSETEHHMISLAASKLANLEVASSWLQSIPKPPSATPPSPVSSAKSPTLTPKSPSTGPHYE